MAITICVLVGYMVLISVVSILSTKLSKRVNNNTTIGYLLAGKSLPWWLVAVMLAGNAVGGSATIGTAQNAYAVGMSAAWYGVALCVGLLVFAFVLSKKLRDLKFSTVPQLLRHYFGEKAAFAFALILTGVLFGVLAMQIIAGGAIVAVVIPEVPHHLALVAVAVIFFLIAFFGGYFGASLSNIVNILVIYIGITLAVVMGINEFGGTDAIAAALPEGNQWFDPVSGMGISTIASLVISVGIVELTSQGSYQACAAAKDTKNVKPGFLVGALLCIPIGIMAAYLGVIAAGAFPGIESSLALPMVAVSLSPAVAGFCLAGLMAADVSTAIGIVCGFTSVVVNDITLKYIRPNLSDRGQLILSKTIVVVMIVAALVVALGAPNIIDMVLVIVGMEIPFCIMLILVFFVPKLVRKSTFTAVIGAGCIGWMFYLFLPGLQAITGEVFWAELPLCLIAWLATLAFDRRRIVFE